MIPTRLAGTTRRYDRVDNSTLCLVLIVEAGVSRFPLVIEIIGWLSIITAAVFALIGRKNFLRLMNRVISLAKPYGRMGGMFAIGFGGFLIYAFI